MILFRQDTFDGRCLVLPSPRHPRSASGDCNKADSAEESRVFFRSIAKLKSVDENNEAQLAQSVHDDASDESAAVGGNSRNWQKILYQPQPFEDNYVPESFLNSLIVNPNLRQYEYWHCVEKTACITQHVSVICLFVLLWRFLRVGEIHSSVLISADIVLLVSGYVARHLLLKSMLLSDSEEDETGGENNVHSDLNSMFVGPRSPTTLPRRVLNFSNKSDELFENELPWSLWGDLKSAVLVFGSVWILSPLLRTLTRNWGGDSIIAMAVMLLVVHVILHDYAFVYRKKTSLELWHQQMGDLSRLVRVWKRPDNSVALNAVVFSAVILASRLDSSAQVFALVFFAMTAFSFLPFLFKYIFRQSSKIYTFALTPICVCGIGGGLASQSGVAAIAFMLVVIFVTFACPFLLIKCLRLKKEIRGPWDIAHVRVSPGAAASNAAGAATPNGPMTPAGSSSGIDPSVAPPMILNRRFRSLTG